MLQTIGKLSPKHGLDESLADSKVIMHHGGDEENNADTINKASLMCVVAVTTDLIVADMMFERNLGGVGRDPNEFQGACLS